MTDLLAQLVALALLVAGFVPLWQAREALRLTTLRHAHHWAMAAWAGWLVATVVAACLGGQHAWVSHLRYGAAAMALCPLMAVLGARRPGERAWHFVVLALLAVLLLPVLQAPLRARSLGPLRLEEAPAILFLLVLAVGVANYVPTRFARAAGLLGVAVTIPLLSVNPWVPPADGSALGHLRATFALASSAWAARQDAAASCGVLSCRKAAGGEGWRVVVERLPVAGWDRVWLDFRDDFGFVWAKRVQDRFNAAAGQLGWPIVLGWSGFRPRITPGTAGLREGQPKESSMNYFGVSAPPTPTFPHQGGGSDSWTAPKGANAAGIVTAILSQPGAVQTAFVSLLQRFVSQEWIRARLTAR